MEITIINAILTGIILFLGVWSYRKNKDDLSLYIGGAFGLFFASHLMTAFNSDDVLDIPIILVRLLAYLIVGFVLYMRLIKGKEE